MSVELLQSNFKFQTLSVVNKCRLDIDRSSDALVVSSDLMRHIQGYVNDATLLRTQGQELIFTLPLASADKFAGNFCFYCQSRLWRRFIVPMWYSMFAMYSTLRKVATIKRHSPVGTSVCT